MLYWTYDLRTDVRNLQECSCFSVYSGNLSLDRGQYCFVCGRNDEDELLRCCKAECFSRYHRKCINKDAMGEFFAFINLKKPECPRHYCSTCFGENNRTTAFMHMSEFKS